MPCRKVSKSQVLNERGIQRGGCKMSKKLKIVICLYLFNISALKVEMENVEVIEWMYLSVSRNKWNTKYKYLSHWHSYQIICPTDKPVRERTGTDLWNHVNEWTRDRASERTNDRVSERTNKRTIEQANGRRTNKWSNEIIIFFHSYQWILNFVQVPSWLLAINVPSRLREITICLPRYAWFYCLMLDIKA